MTKVVGTSALTPRPAFCLRCGKIPPAVINQVRARKPTRHVLPVTLSFWELSNFPKGILILADGSSSPAALRCDHVMLGPAMVAMPQKGSAIHGTGIFLPAEFFA